MRTIVLSLVTGKAIVILTLLNLAAGCAKRDDPEQNDASRREAQPVEVPKAERESEVLSVKLEEIGRAYRENEINADRLYKGKRLRITVTPVSPVVRTRYGQPVLSARSGFTPGAAEDAIFMFSKNYENEAARIEQGKPVRLEATCSGTEPAPKSDVWILRFDNCRLIP